MGMNESHDEEIYYCPKCDSDQMHWFHSWSGGIDDEGASRTCQKCETSYERVVTEEWVEV